MKKIINSSNKERCSLTGSKNSTNVCYSNKSIQMFIQKIIKKKPSKNISDNVNLVTKYMKAKYKCKTSTCWAKHSIIFRKEFNNVFLPKSRWSRDRLVSNYDIYNVLKQYESFYNKNEKKIFKYLSDWDYDLQVIKEDRSRVIKLLNESKDYKYRAIVISLWGDKYKYMKHWTCVLLNKDKNLIQFFDSNGDVQTRWLIGDTIEFLSKKTGYKIYEYNNLMVQYDYEHCGIFVIHFICSMVNDKKLTLNKFIKRLIDKLIELGEDKYYKYIYSLRDKYYLT